MLTILEFIFKDFWHFIGVLLLLETICSGLNGMFSKVIIKNRKEYYEDYKFRHDGIQTVRPSDAPAPKGPGRQY